MGLCSTKYAVVEDAKADIDATKETLDFYSKHPDDTLIMDENAMHFITFGKARRIAKVFFSSIG